MWSLSIGIQLLMLILLVDNINSYSGTFLDNSTKDVVISLKPYNEQFAIMGGIRSVVGEFPFMAALGWLNKTGDLEFHCGGMLITSNMVLTAAHCVYLDGKPPHVVNIGGNPLSNTNRFNEYPVVNVAIFPDYRSNQAYHDIALLELQDHTIIQPVCLWTNPIVQLNNVTAIGYGLTAFAGEKSESLLKVNLTVFPETYCQPFFKRQRKFKHGLSHAHICAGDTNGKKDTCQGDSGGPLIAQYKNTNYAVGITSTGQACSGFPPAIYTKISSYITWINDHLIKESYSMLRECP